MQNTLNYNLLEQKIKELLSYHDLSGTVSLSLPDKTIYRESYGFADREKKLKNPPEPTYVIRTEGSMFLPTAIMKLYSEGKIDLKDKISLFLPEYKHSDEITVEQLLMHTSGITDYAGGKLFVESEKLNRGCDEKKVLADEAAISVTPISYEKVLELVGEDALVNVPGQRKFQSATNYIFLKRIYEQVSGESFRDYIQNEIIGNLKLKNTVCGYCPNTTPYAVIHEKEHFRINYHEENETVLTTDITDFTAYARAFFEKKLFSAKAWKKGIVHDKHGRAILCKITSGLYSKTYSTLGMSSVVIYDSETKLLFTALLNEGETYRYEDGRDRIFSSDICRIFEEALTYPKDPKLVAYAAKNAYAAMNLEIAPHQYEFVDDARSSICFAFSEKTSKALVLTDRGRAIGLSVVKADKKISEYHIEIILIDRRFQNRGYGKVMVLQAVEYLKKRGAKMLEIEVARTNDIAKRLYESVGFQVVYVTDDFCALRMYL